VDEKKHKQSLAVRLGGLTLFVLNGLAAVSGVLMAALRRSELNGTGGASWDFSLVRPWSVGGLVAMVPILIATVVFVAWARERVFSLLRWMLLFLILVGIVGHISSFVPEFRVVTIPLVELFDL